MNAHSHTPMPQQLADLLALRRWVCWKYERIAEGRATKIPYRATGGRASCTDPRTWATFADLPLGAFDGPGLMLGDGLQGVDLDACLDVDGDLEPWAAEVVDRLASYTEVSPSGRGVKVVIRGPDGPTKEVQFGDPVVMPDGTTKQRELAYFTGLRYFTITGQVFRDAPIRTIGADQAQWLRDRVEQIRAEKRAKKNTGSSAKSTADPIPGLAPWLHDLIVNGVPQGQRSEQFFKVIKALQGRGYDAEQIAALLSRHSTGIAAKYAGRLREQIVDCMNKPGTTATTMVEVKEGQVAPQFSDDHLALEFVAKYGAGLRWSPGLDWMRDAGSHWVRDDHMRRYHAARMTCRSAANAAESRLGLKLASKNTVAAVVSLAQSDPSIVVPAEVWDRDPFALNTPDGVVDLRTGDMRRRNRDDYLTQITSVSPMREMRCPTWLRFIGEVFNHDVEMIEFVQRMSGYILTGDRREQKLFFAHGTGANGKSTMLDLWLWIMGTYALKLPTTALMLSKVERHPTELAQLRGKRLAMSNELEEGSFWAEARIKELTGDDTLTARFMRQDNFTFTQTQKHLIAGNHKPRLKGGDPAIARRMVLIPFNEVFSGHRKDKALPEKLRAEAPAVLAWLIEGARKWSADGLAIPSKVHDASRDYLAEHDDVALWIEECCDTGPSLTDSASELYASFRLWKRERGEGEPSMTVWGQRMSLYNGIRKRHSGGIKYDGIRLRIEVRALILNRGRS